MLIILLSWLYILFLAYTYGHALIALLARMLKEAFRIHFSIVVLVGFALLAALTSYLSLFINIGLTANLILFLPAIGYAATRRKALSTQLNIYRAALKSTSLMVYVMFAFVAGMALVLSSIPEGRYDEGLYYRQVIKWMEHYPAIPGLGNLHPKLSFNSSWHLLSALFSFSFMGLKLNDLNGLFYIVAAILALQGLNAILRGEYRLSNFFKVMTIAPLQLVFTYFISPSPDIVVPYLIWAVFILFIRKIEHHELQKFDLSSLLILTLSVFAVTAKLSAAAIAIIPLYLLLVQLRHKNYRAILPMATLVLVLVTPWFARSIILSGYLVYPLYQLDIFDVDWKVPTELMELEVLETRSFAKVRGMLFSEVQKMSVVSWSPYWFKQLRTGEKMSILISLLLCVFFPFFAYIKLFKEKITEHKVGYIILWLTVFGGILFWLSTAPHYRYGMPYILAISLFCFSYLFYRFYQAYPLLASPALLILLMVSILRPTYSVQRWYRGFPEYYLLYPGNAPYEQPQPVSYGGIDIYVPQTNAQCWDAPLPCAPFVVDGLELRSGQLADGFRIVNPDPERYSQKRLESMKENGVEYNIMEVKSVQ